MSVDYKGTLIVGYEYEEFRKVVEQAGMDPDDTYCDDLSFDRVASYYDADNDASIFGIEVVSSGTYSYRQLDIDEIAATVKTYTSELEIEYGIKPKLYIVSEGY